MEDGRDVSQRPDDPARPVVGLEETSRHLRADTRDPLPVAPGRPARHDPESARQGVITGFLVSEPLRGWRQGRLSARRTGIDGAHGIQELSDVHSPPAECIVLVMDHRNPHSPASLYEAFPPAEATRLADRVAIHHTPTHGSWLTMAEIALSILARPCRTRRRDDRAMRERDGAAWAAARNDAAPTIDGRVTTADARITLTRLSPVIQA